MNRNTKIRWTDASWNPLSGCSKVSLGCNNCYAETIALRFKPGGLPWTKKNATANLAFREHELDAPSKLVEAHRIFVCDMGDLFHEDADDTWRDQVLDAMLKAPQHTYQLLTKRPEIARDYLARWLEAKALDRLPSNWWLGVSIESSRFADRADVLRSIPVDVRFISAEPLLGSLSEVDFVGISWVIVGGESGPGFRPMDVEWARELRDRCVADGIAFYFKQHSGSITEIGQTLDDLRWEQYPDDLAEPFQNDADQALANASKEIRALWPEVRKAEWSAVEARLKIGAQLAAAKAACPKNVEYGHWLTEQQFPFSTEWARTLRLAAENADAVRAILKREFEQTGRLPFKKAVKEAVAPPRKADADEAALANPVANTPTPAVATPAIANPAANKASARSAGDGTTSCRCEEFKAELDEAREEARLREREIKHLRRLLKIHRVDDADMDLEDEDERAA